MKKVLIFLLVIFSSVTLFSEQITKVAVVDMELILTEFGSDTRAMRALDREKESFMSAVENIQQDINELELKLLEAEDENDDEEVLRLDNLIFDKKEYLADFIRVKGQQINSMQEDAADSMNRSQLEEIYRAISYIAENEGFSLVMDTSADRLIWHSYDVDITDEVMEHLQRLRDNE